MSFFVSVQAMLKNQFGHATRALYSRNYRLFFSGQGVTLTGNWMQRLALAWLVMRLGGSAADLGIMSALTQMPTILLGPLAGVVADRYEKRALLRIIQLLAVIQAFGLAFLTLAEWITLWQLFALALFMGCINAFEMTIRQSFVVEMVDDKQDLPNAVALNSVLFNSARAIGPALGGQFVRFFGEGLCFLLNGFSYAASNFALRAMQLPEFKRAAGGRRNIAQEFLAGFQYIRQTPSIGYSLMIVAAVSTLGLQQMILLPVLTRDFLGGGSELLGNLMLAFGLGAVLTAAFVATRHGTGGLTGVVFLGCLFTGMSQLVMLQSSGTAWVFFMVALNGYGAIAAVVVSNTIIQLLVAPEMRGRVASFYSLSLMGIGPLGGYLSGLLTDWQGIGVTMTALGIGSLAAAGLYRVMAGPAISSQLNKLSQVN